jgi:CheY-like chemotaxis protein
MGEDVQEHLFEPFFTTKDVDEGRGLGLAQVYGIVKQHGGFVDVDTAPGEGATFAIFLPVVEGQEPAESTVKETRAPRSGSETVLVVEESEPLQRAIQAGLESAGYDVIAVTNAPQALSQVTPQDIDLVLADVSGVETRSRGLLAALRADFPGVAVVALKGEPTTAEVRTLRSEGFVDVLSKPFSLEDLEEVVRGALRGRGKPAGG